MANVLNPDAELDGKTLITGEDDQDIDGLKNFTRSPGPPYAVEPGSGMVPNLDAEKLGGQAGAYYRDASHLNAGIIPPERIPDPLPVRSGENLYNLNADNLVSGTVPAGRLPPLNASNLVAGTVPVARLGAGVTTVVGSAAVGAQHNFAPGLAGDTLVFLTGIANLAITGIAAGVLGQRVTFKNRMTAPAVATFAHNNTGSAAGNRLVNPATSAPTPIAFDGWITYQYSADGFWYLVAHEQGAWITPAYNAADFTSNTVAGWGVDVGDIQSMRYRLVGRTMIFASILITTTVPAGATSFNIGNGQWGGFTAASSVIGCCVYNDNGAGNSVGFFQVNAGGAAIVAGARVVGGAYAASANGTAVHTTCTFEVN